MGLNFAKTPLTAIFYASFAFLFSTFIFTYLPYSDMYSEAMAAFPTSLLGYIMLVATGLWISVILVLTYSAAYKMGVLTLVMAFISVIGLVWFMPSAYDLVFGNPAGIANLDMFLVMGTGAACTLFLFICALLFFRRTGASNKKGVPLPPLAPPARKLKILGLIIRMLILPFIYMILYFAAWYFLEWGNDAVRLYYGGPGALPGFTVALIDLLTKNPIVLPFILIKGLLYLVLLLPIFSRIPDKRALFIVITVMLFLGDLLQVFRPSPFMSFEVQLGIGIHNAALLGAYAIISAVFLHTAYAKNANARPAMTPHQQAVYSSTRARAIAAGQSVAAAEAAANAAVAAVANRPVAPNPAAAPADDSKQVLPGVSGKKAAEMVQNTMKGKT